MYARVGYELYADEKPCATDCPDHRILMLQGCEPRNEVLPDLQCVRLEALLLNDIHHGEPLSVQLAPNAVQSTVYEC